MLASRTKESAESASPNSSARAGGTRPAATGRCSRALAHQPVDVRVEHVVERARAAAREREADHRRGEEPSGGTPWAPTNIPAAPVTRSSDMIRGFVSVT